MSVKPSQLKYHRILLKCSGEALMGNTQNIDPLILNQIAQDVAELIDLNVEVGLVIGGGNLFRGKALSQAGLGRITGDHMGMLATIMNALALRDAMEHIGLCSHIMSAIPVPGVVDAYCQRQAVDYLSRKHVVIFAAGIGNPFFTTDTAACLRAVEIKADVVLKATKVAGIYSDDPIKNPEAKRYDYLSYQQVLNDGLEVMDLTAICLCQAHNMPIQVFNMATIGALQKIVMGEQIGTIVGAANDQ